eukprot:SAG22_NODE_6745_length_817_cov_0.704735_2_plen_73_part_01
MSASDPLPPNCTKDLGADFQLRDDVRRGGGAPTVRLVPAAAAANPPEGFIEKAKISELIARTKVKLEAERAAR